MRTVEIGPKTKGVLYHYTNHDSLYNIVESKLLRASHVYYMNDSSEIIYAVDQFIKLAKERIDQNTDDESTLKFCEQLLEWVKRFRSDPHCIFSFSLSEKGNLLSQWRAYTRHGTGISIGFNQSDAHSKVKCNTLLESLCHNMISRLIFYYNCLNFSLQQIAHNIFSMVFLFTYNPI